MAETRTPEGYENFVNKYIYGVKDWNEYLKLRREDKGDEYFDNLLIKEPIMSEPIIHGF